jgi:hypothetical protein
MNKIYKVMYSKVKQCCVVVSEIAKSHGHNGESSGVKKHAALTAAVLIALGSLSFTTAFVPMTAEAADKTRTDGSDFVGVERTNGLIDESKYENSGGKGAQGADSITLGLHAQAGAGTITIGDRRSSASMGSVYVGHGDIANPELDTGGWVTSIGYNSDATGYGSIALGSNAVAKNFYAKDSKGNSLKLNDDTKFRLNPKPDIQRASVAIGYGASADNGNIAIGSYSDASTDLRTAKTADGKEIKSYLTDKKADSYVSVGDGIKDSETQYRRISNVADGASASDVATVGQLQALSAKVGVYDAGFGIVIDSDKDNKKNTISLNRKLGTNLDKTGHVYLDVSDTGLVLGTVVDGASGTDMDLHYGATGDYAVTVGGGANTASGKASVVLGGSLNKASNEATVASGGSSNVASGSMAAVYGGSYNEASGADATILGGELNKASNTWTAVGGGSYNEASGKYASVWGGSGNNATDDSAAVYGGLGNSAYGSYSAILGGGSNKAGGAAVVSGGASNEAAGLESAVLGGVGNIVTGANATAVGGFKGSVNGVDSVGILGGSTGINAPLTLAAGYQSTVTDTGVTSTPITEEEAEKFQEEGTHPGLLVGSNDPDNLSFKILDHFATAVGYQATADEAQTVAFGHDKGDTYYGTTTYTWKQKATIKDGHYYDEYGSEINEDDYKSLMNADGTWNDYSQPIATVEEKKYDSAYYNRLVKAADGIEDHDAVVMEQLKKASDVGSHIKVYKTDTNGNVQFDENNKPIEDTSDAAKTKAAQKASEDAWGEAIGTGEVADPDASDTETNGSQQLVTGGTVYKALNGGMTKIVIGTPGENGKDGAPGTIGLVGPAGADGKNAEVDITIQQGKDNDAKGIKGANGVDGKDGITRIVYKDAAGDHQVATMEDGLKFAGDDGQNDATKAIAKKLNNTIDIIGGADRKKLTENNIGVNNVDGKLKVQLAQNLTGITSISNQTTNGTTTTGAKIELGTNGTTISGGDVNVSTHKITGLQDGTATTDAATVGQMKTAIGDAKTKYYSVQEGLRIGGFSTNENNDGASASTLAGLAAGYETGTTGIASTVVGSYSGVIGSSWLQGAAAVSVGTVNVNNNTGTSKAFSGVANSIVGQANMTTDSNAAIIVGAGNNVTNSYRDLDKDAFSNIKSAVASKDANALKKALQDAVPKSGGQVMVMGGGNNVESAYMSQVVGVGNTVTGADSTYAEGTSTQYNFVDGFQNELTNGKNDYIIGSNNSVTGDHIDKNQSNIVVGDNHTLTNRKNNVVIGSADKKENKNKELTASDATVIGHNADVTVDGGVAIGSGSVSKATAEADAEGYDPVSTTTNKASANTSATWKATTGAVSIGGVNGNTTTTRRITNLAAGFNDTDAVNVAQIKKLASVDASNIGKNLKGADGKTAAADAEKTTNENAWGEALGTGTVTKDSKQLVTGSTVYNEVRPSKDGKYVKMSQTTGENLLNLDSQVQTNTDKLSDVDSRSVKYDTKTVNDKTVVDNSKITLAGEGGTTITNLKDGVNANDAATMGQLNDRISGVTYKAGDGIKYGTDADNNKTISVNKGDGLKFTEDHKLAVNTGKHLSVNTDGQIDVGDNGAVAENDGNLVTGDTVYKALNGGMTKMIIGTPGKNGKDGTPGTIGLVGPAGTNGKDGAVDITIQRGEDGKDGTKGANGVDGKDGINRIVYEDKNGKHQVATMEDGLKFAGDDGQKEATKAIAKKLNNTVDIIGGADSKKLTANNIGVNNVGGKLKVQLAQDLTGITSISGSTDDKGAKITLDTTDKNISVNGGRIKDVATNLGSDGKIISGNENNAANMSDVQTLVQQGVDNGYTNGDGITIQKDGTSGKNVISVNQGDGLKFDRGKLVVNTGDGLTVDKTTKALKIKTSDSNLKVDSNGIGLSDKITIGSDKTKQVTIDGTNGEISGLTNTTWDSKADYSKSTKAATESQVDAAVKDAVKQAGENDIHVAAGSYAVNDQNQVSMNLVDKSNDTKGTVIITDVAKSSEMGDVSKLADGVKNAGGKTTTVVDAINNVNENVNSVDRKVGDLNYFEQNDGKTHTVTNGTSITKAIGDLDSAVQNATEQAGKHTIVSTKDTNLDVKNIAKDGEAANYQIALNQDLNVNTVTAKTVTTDNLTVNKSATIGGVTIANKTISGLDDTKIEKDSPNATNAVNERTIYNELRPTSDGSYIKQTNTTAQNLTSLDTQVRATHDLINSDGKTIKIGGSDAATKIDVNGKDGKGRVITGVVSDANDPTSAANVGYVNGVTAANTQQIYRDMNNAYGRLNNNINKAAAGSNALAALHPLDYDPDDKADFAVGYGHYRNANAAAVGAFYHPNENTMVNVGVSLGNGDPGFNAGVSFKVGRGGAGREAMSKTEMAKVINSQSKEIDALKKDNADKDKRIDALEQKMAEILAKLDKNGK